MPPKPNEKRTRVSSSEDEISAHVLVDDAILKDTVKPVLSGHRIKWTPSIKRTVAEVPKFTSLIGFK